MIGLAPRLVLTACAISVVAWLGNRHGKDTWPTAVIILMGPVARLILDGYGYGPFTAPSRTTILQIGIAASCLAALLVISLVSRRFYPVPFSSLSLITFFAVLFGFVDLIGDEIAARMVELVDIAMLAMLIALDLRSMRANSPPPLAERVDDP